MGNENSTDQSPNKFSKPRRILSKTTNNNNNSKMPKVEKPQIIQNLSKFSKIISKPKNILDFISQTENSILLKNMNDSQNIGLINLNILIENNFNNPFLENQIKYFQIVEDSMDKKILGKLNYQSKEFNQNQIEQLTNNLIEINNDYNNNNLNIDNISSIHKRKGKYGSREESPTSRDEELDLTSFSTTIGGKISPSASNYNNNNSKNHNNNYNNKQIKTFKLMKKDGYILPGNDNNSNFNYKNSSSRHDSPYSINSSNTISNVLSSINGTNMNSKISSNNSFKEKNNNRNNKNYENRNNCSNNSNSDGNSKRNIIIEDNSNNKIFNGKTYNRNNNNNIVESNINNINRMNNRPTISKKIVKKKLIDPQRFTGPLDGRKTPNKEHNNNTSNLSDNYDNHIQHNLTNIDDNYNNFIQNDFSTIDNNTFINNTFSCLNNNNNKKIKRGFIIPNIDSNFKAKSPISTRNKILNNNLDEQESESSQIIFNNVRKMTQGNISYSNNNNSSMLNNLSAISNHKRVNNTNILNNDKLIKNYLNKNDSSILKTEPNKDNSSYILEMKGRETKKKIINDKKTISHNISPNKKEKNNITKNMLELNENNKSEINKFVKKTKPLKNNNNIIKRANTNTANFNK